MSHTQPDQQTQAQQEEPRSPHCAYLRDDGARCRAMARRPSDFCYWHDPETAPDRATGPRTAAAAPPDPFRLPLSDLTPAGEQPLHLETPADICRLLQLTARHLAGAAHPDFKRAYAVNTIAATLLRTTDIAGLEADLAETRRTLFACNDRLNQEVRETDRLKQRIEDLQRDRDRR